MEERNIFYENYLNKNQHLIDSEPNNLSYKQKEFLRIFLVGENYFIPYTIDGDWSFADNFKVIDKVELTEALLNGNWSFEISATDDVYIVIIYLNDDETKSKVLEPYRRFKDHYLNDNIKSNIELYVPYSYVLKIFKDKLFDSPVWDKLILKEDLESES